MKRVERLVRCIDCAKKKRCPKLRVNRYESKSCDDYAPDLKRSSNMNKREAERRKIQDP